MVATPVKADALLGVIGYHIVPMHLENSEEQQEQEEEEESSVDDGETTVAQHAIQLNNKNFKTCIAVRIILIRVIKAFRCNRKFDSF